MVMVMVVVVVVVVMMVVVKTWLNLLRFAEVFDANSNGYDERSDIYSFAMILWNMANPTEYEFDRFWSA